MKKLIFITLKILEISILPVFYVLMCLVARIPIIDESLGCYGGCGFFNIYNFGIGILLTSIIFLTILLIIYVFFFIKKYYNNWIESNKKLTNKIYNKLKK